MKRWPAAAILALAGLPSAAQAPDTSVRPPSLPNAIAAEPAPVATRPKARPPVPEQALSQERPADRPSPAPVRPRSRPAPAAPQAEQSTETTATAPAPRKPRAAAAIRPEPRSGRVERRAAAERDNRRKGSVCGDLDIQGEVVGRVTSEVSACGIKDAVRVRSVAGVSLSQPALLNCPTAAALKRWVAEGLQPAMPRRDPVVRLQVAAHYACRGRNNQRGAKISEHGKGNAIDISAFVLRSGKVMTVLSDYSRKGPLGVARRAACGIFSTVLGPGSDRYHSDHFHLDTARHRGGPYCR